MRKLNNGLQQRTRLTNTTLTHNLSRKTRSQHASTPTTPKFRRHRPTSTTIQNRTTHTSQTTVKVTHSRISQTYIVIISLRFQQSTLLNRRSLIPRHRRITTINIRNHRVRPRIRRNQVMHHKTETHRHNYHEHTETDELSAGNLPNRPQVRHDTSRTPGGVFQHRQIQGYTKLTP